MAGTTALHQPHHEQPTSGKVRSPFGRKSLSQIAIFLRLGTWPAMPASGSSVAGVGGGVNESATGSVMVLEVAASACEGKTSSLSFTDSQDQSCELCLARHRGHVLYSMSPEGFDQHSWPFDRRSGHCHHWLVNSRLPS